MKFAPGGGWAVAMQRQRKREAGRCISSCKWGKTFRARAGIKNVDNLLGPEDGRRPEGKLVGKTSARRSEMVPDERDNITDTLLTLRRPPPPSLTRLRPPCCRYLPPRSELLPSLSFLAVGLGVALPWSSLRAGISFFVARFDAAFYTYLFVAYNLAQALCLALQATLDSRFDVRYGANVTFPIRLCASLALLAASQLALPYAVGDQVSALGVALALGFFDGVAFGSASQLFSAIRGGSAGAYFLGSSLASLAAIGLSFATGFAELPPAATEAAGAPRALVAFYACCSCVSLLALCAVAALLCSRQGKVHLGELDDAFLENAPMSPRALARQQEKQQRGGSGSPGARGGGSPAELELAVLGPGKGGRGGAAATAQQQQLQLQQPPSPAPSSPPRGGALFYEALPIHASIFITWAATVAGDSLLGYVPSQVDTAGAASASFRLLLLYCSLGGELGGKNFMVFCGMRRGAVRGGASSGGTGDGGGDLAAAMAHWQRRLRVRDGGSRDGGGIEGEEEGEFEEEEAGKGGDAATLAPLVPCVASARTLLCLCTARLLLLLPPLLLYSTQQLWGPQRGGANGSQLLRGYLYSDTGVCVLQAVFDGTGAFLSSLSYAMLSAQMDAPDKRTLASSQLGLSLTAGSFLGLAISISLSRLLPSAAV